MRLYIKQFIFILFAFALLPVSTLAQMSGDWKVLPPTPTARTEVAVVNHQDKIYLIGGFTPKGISEQVEVYDPNIKSWSTVAPLPAPRHHTTAVSTNGRIYVIGGFSSGMWTPVNTVYAYDAEKNEWTEQAPMPTERGALATGVIDGKIYAVGGALKKFFRLRNTNANEVYDPKTDTWKQLAPIPTPRDHLTVSVAYGLLYAIGGRVNVNYNQNLNANEAYDPKSDRWKTRAPLPTARSGIGSAVADGAIHLLNGGPHPGGGGSKYHQMFTPISF